MKRQCETGYNIAYLPMSGKSPPQAGMQTVEPTCYLFHPPSIFPKIFRYSSSNCIAITALWAYYFVLGYEIKSNNSAPTPYWCITFCLGLYIRFFCPAIRAWVHGPAQVGFS